MIELMFSTVQYREAFRNYITSIWLAQIVAYLWGILEDVELLVAGVLGVRMFLKKTIQIFTNSKT